MQADGAQGLALVRDIGPDAGAFVDLMLDAMDPFIAFVFDSREQARSAYAGLLADGCAEFGPPAVTAAFDAAGRIAGAIVCLTAAEDRVRRARAALSLAKAGWLERVPRLRARLQDAGRVLVPVGPSDLYVKGLAVAPGARHKGTGSLLFAAAEAEARARGLSRMVFEVFAGNTGAIRIFEHWGFTAFGDARVEDAVRGRVLACRHMVKTITAR